MHPRPPSCSAWLAILIAMLGSAPGALATEVVAIPANDFLESVGMGVWATTDPVFNDKQATAMRYLGVRWFRGGNSDALNPVLDLASRSGLKCTWGIDSAFGLYHNSAGSLAIELAGARQLAAAGRLLAMEGANEPDNWNVKYQGVLGGRQLSWMPVAKLQRDYYQAVKADPVLKDYPVWSISHNGGEVDNVGLQWLVIPSGANCLLPDGTRYADVANMHNYVIWNGAQALVDNAAWLAADPTGHVAPTGYPLREDYGLTWYGHFTGYSATQLQNLPRVTTETGWPSANGGEGTQAHALLNVYLAQFKRGYQRTAIFCMMDGTDGSYAPTFGIVRRDFTYKPAAVFIHNLTTILADHGSTTPGTLGYAIANQPATVHDLLLQKSDGAMELIVWSEKALGQDQVTVTLNAVAAQAILYDPTVGTGAIRALANVAAIPLTLSNNPVIIELPAGAPVTVVPTITTQPPSLTVTAGQTATFTVAASGNPAPTYQWQRNGTAISGATNSSYTTAATVLGDSGATFRCVAANASGSATSNAATLTVVPAGSGSLSGSAIPATTGYDLNARGSADWAHWGLGQVYTAFDHKASGGSQISNVTTVGTGGNYGAWSDPTRATSWTGGTPTASATAAPGYIWANGALNTGFSFTAPASQSNRTLSVFVGASWATCTVTARLSDNSAPVYSTSFTGPGTRLVTLNYQAGSTNQTLTVQVLKTGDNAGSTTGSADLVAAWLETPAVAPTITTQPANATVTIGQTATFTVAASGNPAPTYQWQRNGTAIAGATAVSYTTAATVAADNGAAFRCVVGNSVGSATSNAAVLTVNVTGTLSGTAVAATAGYDLNARGGADWAHWGLGQVYTAFDHKASGGSQISNVTTVGTGGNYGAWSDPTRATSWTGGTPTASATAAPGYIWANGALNTGFSFTAPANPADRTLSVFVGASTATCTVTARLSDDSAPVYSTSFAGPGTRLVTLTYRAMSAGQTLKVQVLKTGNNAGTTNGSADLVAAWLANPGAAMIAAATVAEEPLASASVAGSGNACGAGGIAGLLVGLGVFGLRRRRR